MDSHWTESVALKHTSRVAEMKNFGVGLRDDVASLFVHHHVLLQVDVIIVNLEIYGKEEGKDGDNGGKEGRWKGWMIELENDKIQH